MKEETSQFLNFYIRHIPEDAVCGVSFLCSQKRPPINKFMLPAELISFDTYPPFYNVYLRTTVLKEALKRGRGLKEDTLGSAVIWVDFDTYKVAGMSQEEALAKLQSLQPAPSCIVNSGHGLQAWWKLAAFSTDVKAIEAASKSRADLLDAGGDRCYDLARILRIPGTLNYKSEPVVDVTLLQLTGTEYQLRDFGVFSLAEADRDLQDRILSEDSARMAGAPLKADGRVDRSRNDAWISTRMLGLGYSQDAVAGVLTSPIWFSGQRHSEHPETTYVETTIKGAQSFADSKPSKGIVESNKHGKPTFDSSQVAKAILERIPTLALGGAPYIYDKGVYRFDTEHTVSKAVIEVLGPMWKPGWHDGVMKWITENTTIDPEKQMKYADLVNVQNGMLNIYDGSIVPHDKTYRSFAQLPVTHVEGATSKRVLDFVSSIVAEDALPAFWEFMGFLLLPDYRYKRVLLLVGPGNTGKSAILSLVRKFLGKENTSSVSLQDLTSNEFLRVELFGKMANIYADLSLSALESSGEVKSLTGGDEIIAHRKYGQPFSFTNKAKLIFSANDFSAVAKPDPTFFERFIVIPCEHVFTAEKAIPNVVDTFESSDLSAFLNYALQGLQRLITNSGFSVSEQAESIKEMKQEFKETADNIVSFITNATGIDRDARVVKADLYAAYRAWTDRAGTTPVSSVRFFRRIKQGLAEFGMSEQYVLMSGTEEHKQTWVYVGRSLPDSGSVKDGIIRFGQSL